MRSSKSNTDYVNNDINNNNKNKNNFYFVTLPVGRTIQLQTAAPRKRHGRKWLLFNRDGIPAFAWIDYGNQKVIIFCAPVKIRTYHLRNISTKLYCYTNFTSSITRSSTSNIFTITSNKILLD